MRVIDFGPYVLHALSKSGESNQTALTEAVWGSSGRNSPHLVRALFPHLQRRGLLTVRKAGRTTLYKLTDAGRAEAERWATANPAEAAVVG